MKIQIRIIKWTAEDYEVSVELTQDNVTAGLSLKKNYKTKAEAVAAAKKLKMIYPK